MDTFHGVVDRDASLKHDINYSEIMAQKRKGNYVRTDKDRGLLKKENTKMSHKLLCINF